MSDNWLNDPTGSQTRPHNIAGVRSVFVIMPFSHTPTRTHVELLAFYQHALKETIEGFSDQRTRYVVSPSGDAFDITDEVVRRLYHSDVVICDLSGSRPNPNVMYELGIRVATTNRPVILIREKHESNRSIFDIGGFHTFEYDPSDSYSLARHLRGKLAGFDSGEEWYQSPVLRALRGEPLIASTTNPSRMARISASYSKNLLMNIRRIGETLISWLPKKLSNGLEPRIDVLMPFIEMHGSALKTLQWSKFPFRPMGGPGLTAVLAEMPYPTVIPSPQGGITALHLKRYYEPYLDNPIAWSNAYAA